MAPQASFILAVSPYHLTSRAAPAMAAALLADRAVTLLPAPFAGSTRGDVGLAVERTPRYLRMMESWRWSIPLWRAGVLGTRHGGEDVADEVRGMCESVEHEAELARLRPLMRRSLMGDQDEYLDAVAGDVLKGGPDPGISIPVAAAIDRFAQRHGVAVVRSAAASVAQRAEARLGRRRFAVAVPVLLRGSGERVMAARRALAEELAELRRHLVRAMEHGDPEGNGNGSCAEGLAVGARAYAAAFARQRERLTNGDDEEGRRVVDGYVSVTGVTVPADAVLRSSLAAVRAMSVGGSRPPHPPHLAGAAQAPMAGGAAYAGAAQERVFTLVVKALNARPE